MGQMARFNRNDVVTLVLVLCAVATTSLVTYRYFFAAPRGAATPSVREPVFLDDWKEHLSKGVRLGLADAPVQLIEFADFECPFCASFHKTVQSVRDRYPAQVTLTFVHYPLPMHRFAELASRAAECAGQQGRFAEMQERLFEVQDQFGLRQWSDFASEAGVPDLMAFDSCVRSREPVLRIVEGKRLAEALNVPGTPTLVVNGWMLGRPPNAEELDRIVTTVISGKSVASALE